jgi:hypothetical protein
LLEADESKSHFTKIFNLAIDAFRVYEKSENIFKNKGSGALTLEKSKDEKCKVVLLVFR